MPACFILLLIGRNANINPLVGLISRLALVLLPLTVLRLEIISVKQQGTHAMPGEEIRGWNLSTL